MVPTTQPRRVIPQSVHHAFKEPGREQAQSLPFIASNPYCRSGQSKDAKYGLWEVKPAQACQVQVH